MFRRHKKITAINIWIRWNSETIRIFLGQNCWLLGTAFDPATGIEFNGFFFLLISRPYSLLWASGERSSELLTQFLPKDYQILNQWIDIQQSHPTSIHAELRTSGLWTFDRPPDVVAGQLMFCSSRKRIDPCNKGFPIGRLQVVPATTYCHCYQIFISMHPPGAGGSIEGTLAECCKIAEKSCQSAVLPPSKNRLMKP